MHADYWFYVHHRWAFDLVLSNPDAVKLYRMSPSQYVAALGGNHGPALGGGQAEGSWLGGGAAGHELAAGVLVKPVEEPVGDGEGGAIGAAGQRQAAN